MSDNCHRKEPFEWYEDALNHIERKDVRSGRDRMLGSVYTCPDCGEYHVSGTIFTLRKRRKGRGKTRRGLVAVRR